jgi:hypothetical protein
MPAEPGPTPEKRVESQPPHYPIRSGLYKNMFPRRLCPGSADTILFGSTGSYTKANAPVLFRKGEELSVGRRYVE